MRKYAIHLCRGASGADDLVQDTVLRALANLHTFEPGSDLRRWLYVIMRNGFVADWRKSRRYAQDSDGSIAGRLAQRAAQPGHIELIEVDAAFGRLARAQREALMLICVDGVAYDKAARLTGCAVGTIKSRVNRARARLAEATA